MDTNESKPETERSEIRGMITEQDNPQTLYSIAVSLKPIADALDFIIEKAEEK